MEKIKLQIIKKIYNKLGVNDGKVFLVVNPQFQILSYHKNLKLANNYLNKLSLS
jgi:hypothetical protein